MQEKFLKDLTGKIFDSIDAHELKNENDNRKAQFEAAAEINKISGFYFARMFEKELCDVFLKKQTLQDLAVKVSKVANMDDCCNMP